MAFVLLGLFGFPATLQAKSLYYVELTDVMTEGVAPELAGTLALEARTAFAALVLRRPGFVATLERAPDAKAAPATFQKYLAKRRIRAFAVSLKVLKAEPSLHPAKAGRSGQVLRFYLELSLLGSAIPDAALALSGNGMAQIDVEVGQTVRAKDEEYARKEALTIALGNALGEAVTKLEANAKRPPYPRAKKNP